MTAILPEIRRATLDDVTAVRDLTRAAYAAWVSVIGREPLPMQADYARAVIEHRIDLLFDETALRGLIETRAEADHILIVNVAVAPAFQGQGWGRTLLGHAEWLARSLELGTLRLYTNQRFTRNIALYQRLGYRIDREEPFGDGVVTHMMKRLDAAPSSLP